MVSTNQGLYGTDEETFYVNANGAVYLIQSPDLTLDYERVDALPAGAVELPDSVIGDLGIPEEII